MRSLLLPPSPLRSPISGLGCAGRLLLFPAAQPKPVKGCAALLLLLPLQTRSSAWRGPSPHLKNVRTTKEGTYLRGGFLSLSARLPSFHPTVPKGGDQSLLLREGGIRHAVLHPTLGMLGPDPIAAPGRKPSPGIPSCYDSGA